MTKIDYIYNEDKKNTIPTGLKKLDRYLKWHYKIELDHYMYLIHDGFSLLASEQKEQIYVDVISRFPETIGYAMLKGATIKGNFKNRFYNEYAHSYMEWMENIETSLIMGIGEENLEIFVTYVKLYVDGTSLSIDELTKIIDEKFHKDYFESEANKGWAHKKIF